MADNNKIVIKVCMGSSCFARGNDKNLAYIEQYIKENNLNAEIELIGQRCENQCFTGPNIIINDVPIKGATIEQVKNKLKKLSLIKK